MTGESIRRIPEIASLDSGSSVIRIPPELDVPITPRVRAILDTEAFRRLARISQLGLVSLVYPAAHHHRFEHSLGVYRLCLLVLRQLSSDDRFAQSVSAEQAETLILAALLHDVGHWPFCHIIEDLQLPEVPSHEAFARSYLTSNAVSDVLEHQWNKSPEAIADLLDGSTLPTEDRILRSILSGPIDVDKMDYLMRDSLHAGVPYGRNFDQARLIASLCMNAQGDGLAITDKGRTAAEMMVFARYVMFSEVYWHHAVRSATAMFQRAFFRCRGNLDLEKAFQLNEHDFVQAMRHGMSAPSLPLLDGLFGPTRRLFKRWREYSYFESANEYSRLARQPYENLVQCSQRLAERLSTALSRHVNPDDVLIDAPPSKLEVQFDVSVRQPGSRGDRPLLELSPVVRTLAETQFDDYVKRVRVFLAPEVRVAAERITDSDALIREAIDA